jgi:hypothetical protein
MGLSLECRRVQPAPANGLPAVLEAGEAIARESDRGEGGSNLQESAPRNRGVGPIPLPEPVSRAPR